MTSPYLRWLFENAVVAEVLMTRDVFACECKFSAAEAANWQPPKEIQKIDGAQFAVISFSGGPNQHGIRHVSLKNLGDFLLEFLS